MNIARFFGTTGDKDLMFENALPAGAGLFLNIGGKKIIMDPGPGTFCSFNATYPGEIKELDAVVLSHVHFDHSTDINAMLEGMTDGGRRKGKLITSSMVYEGESGIVHNYLKPFLSGTCLVDKTSVCCLDDVIIEAVEHQHGILNYGYRFSYGDSCVSVVTDTVFFEGLSEKYSGSTSMIINVPYYEFPAGKRPKHLCIKDVKTLLDLVKPKRTIITHFGKNIIERDIFEIAQSIGSEMNLTVAAAVTGKDFELV